MSNGRVKFGCLPWPQYTDWPTLRETGALVDRMGFDSLWTWDHLYPIVGSHEGPIFEGYLTLAGWASVTNTVTLGLMVGANPFRNPALTAKMATTLDHICGGRAILGIGGAWFETEHRAFGLNFGSGHGERLDWLDEAVLIMRGMLDGNRPSGRKFYATREVINEPPPLQRHMRILIGGGGERKTLATVARYADMWNVGGDVAEVRHKDEVLQRWCKEVGRDHTEIERTLGVSIVVAKTEGEGKKVAEGMARHNRGWKGLPEIVGTPEQVVEHLAPFLDIGFHHIVLELPTPFDPETLELVASEVRPALDERLAR
jgi:alkanesulfonate monooxygenase SsuD/methylene tetrahydromethanopterin reductase-like flavin-dependent oxidoreductase (luciferase family)